MPEEQAPVSLSELQDWLRDRIAPQLHTIVDAPPDYGPVERVTQDEAALLTLVADLIINADPEDLYWTDGSGGPREGDGGFDIVHIAEGEQTTQCDIYQVQAPKLEKIEAGQFGRRTSSKFTEDLNHAFRTIFDQASTRKLNPDARNVRLTIREAIDRAGSDKESPLIEIRVRPVSLKLAQDGAVDAYLRRAEELAKQVSESHERVVFRGLRPILPEDLWRKSLGQGTRSAPEELKFRVLGEVADSGDGYPKLAFVHAKDIVEAYRAHEDALFDSNLRFFRGKTDVNEVVLKELQTEKGLRTFHVKNNGLVISGNSIRLPRGRGAERRVVVRKPQIVNGGQTARLIHQAWMERMEAPEVNDNQRWLDRFEDTLVSVRFVVSHDPRQTDIIAIASNTQNKLSKRTLQSSDPSQKALALSIAREPRFPWFLEIKDGEWDAIRRNRDLMQAKTGKVQRDFRQGSRTLRLDNQKLAAALVAFYGFASDVKDARLFDSANFRLVFHSAIEDDKWVELTRELKWSSDSHKRLLAARRPGPQQCLLAYFVFSYWKQQTLTDARALVRAYEVRGASDAEFQDRCLRNGRWNVSEDDVNKAKSGTEYYAERALKSSYKTLCYETMALLRRRYGDLTEDLCARLLCLPQFDEMLQGHKPGAIGDFRGQSVDTGPLAMLGRVYLAATRRFVNGPYDAAFKKMLSPQMSMLQLEWRVRLGDAIGEVLTKLGDSGYRQGTDLDSLARPDATDWQGLLPDLPAE